MVKLSVRADMFQKRRAVMAVLLSGLFPGLGQLYNGERLKAVLFLVGGAVTGFGPLSPLNIDISLDDPAADLKRVLLASLPFLIIALWSVIDAYRVARRTVAK
jgi:hypothetical protein